MPTVWPFIDPIRNQQCLLVDPGPEGRVYPMHGEPKIGIEHPGCDRLADLAIELDAFYCPTCGWNGRVSGAWCAHILDRGQEQTDDK